MLSTVETPPEAGTDDQPPVASVARLFRVFGEPTRLATLELLRGGELPVQAIADELGLSQSGLSNHLACLRRCGCVVTRREHRRIFYRLANDRIADMLELGRALQQEQARSVETCQRLSAEEIAARAADPAASGV